MTDVKESKNNFKHFDITKSLNSRGFWRSVRTQNRKKTNNSRDDSFSHIWPTNKKQQQEDTLKLRSLIFAGLTGGRLAFLQDRRFQIRKLFVRIFAIRISVLGIHDAQRIAGANRT